MIVLDTNVLSELMHPKGSKVVTDWADAQTRNSLFTTAISQSEILFGIAILPKGSRRQSLYDTAETLFRESFAHRILPFGQTPLFHLPVAAKASLSLSLMPK